MNTEHGEVDILHTGQFWFIFFLAYIIDNGAGAFAARQFDGIIKDWWYIAMISFHTVLKLTVFAP